MQEPCQIDANRRGGVIVETVEQVIGGLPKAGIYTVVYNSTKEALKKSRQTKVQTPANLEEVTVTRKAVFNLSKIDYQTLVKTDKLDGPEDPNSPRAGKTYAVPVSSNLLLWKHKTKDEHYIRVYKMANTDFIKSVFIGAQDKAGNKMTEEDVNLWQAEYGDKPHASDVFNIKTSGIVAVYNSSNVVYLAK